MCSHGEAEAYVADLNGTVRELATAAHKALISEGCASYVKTIYVGYDIDGEMVAALYGHADHVEIALALPEDAQNRLLVDASHLTWRTLPVAAVVRTMNDLVELQALLARSSERVRLSQHSVARDNDYFIRSKRIVSAVTESRNPGRRKASALVAYGEPAATEESNMEGEAGRAALNWPTERVRVT